MNDTPTKKKPQQKTAQTVNFKFRGLRLVCDECALPLHLYGENFFDSYNNGRANILRVLCDLCALNHGLLEVAS